MRAFIFTLLLLLTVPVFSEVKNPVLDAMKKELLRSKKGLFLKGFKSPYFIAYRIKDTKGFSITAKIGALYPSPSTVQRKVYVEVRVGSYDFDNFSNTDLSFSFHAQDYYPVSIGPIEDNEIAIRHVLWLLSDYNYKAALSDFNRLKGEKVYQSDTEEKLPSFTKEVPNKWISKVHKISLNKKEWIKKIKELSKIFLNYPEIFDSKVQFMVSGNTKHFVNTEGSEIVEWGEFYEFHIVGYSRAKDGKLVEFSKNLYFRDKNKIPSMEELKGMVVELINTIMALREADTINPITCPTILSPEAAGVFFHETIGHRLEGQRQKKKYEGKTFKDKVGKKILPDFITIYDDPTVKKFKDWDLYGYYKFDDEGVKAQKAMLIEKGVLKGFLMSRNPIKGFSKSNGHGRASGYSKPTARMANLFVMSDKQVPYEKLKQMLIEEVKKQKKPFGIIVKQIKGGYTNTISYGFQAFKGLPTLIYKVDPKTGKETLVRGVEIVGTPLVSINKIVATGNDYGVFNGYCGAESGYIPVSTIAPSILFSELEFQKDSLKKERGIIMKSPYARDKK